MIPLLDKSNENTPLNVTKSSTKNKSIWKIIGIVFILAIAVLIYVLCTNLNSNINASKNIHSINNALLNHAIHPSIISETTEYYKEDGEDDKISSLPNMDESSCSLSTTNCGFNQYSGYLLANNNNEIHYWFIEADTYDDPTTKPLFFWTNGGPGCSGMDGLLTEQGPWRVANNLDVQYNPYSWINEVNMIFLEQPYGVGFSSADPSDVVGGDVNAANDMDAVIRNFLTKFPQYMNADIYLSSESWGGHYCPITTYTILQHNDEGYEPYINYRGFLLGNPYTDFYENTYGFVGDIYGHGLLMSRDWDQWRAECWDNQQAIDELPLCSQIYVRAYMASWNVNVYALDWPQCIQDEDWSNNKHNHLHFAARKFIKNVLDYNKYDELKMNIKKDELQLVYDRLNGKIVKKNIIKDDLDDSDDSDDSSVDVGSSSYLPCIEYNMANYLNLESVQLALNVKPTEWTMCSNPVWNAWPESDYESFIEEYYTMIIDDYSTDLHLKLAIYSGDDDSVCGLQGTQYWLDRWQYQPDWDNNWEPWEDDDEELGGFYTKYMQTNNENVALHFLTVRTAGHMVPTTEPGRALTLLRKYLYEWETA